MNRKLLAAALVAVIPSVSLADGIEDYYHQVYQQRFFGYSQSARAVGMGGSSSVTSMNSSAVTANPAGIGVMKDADVSINYAHEQLSGNDLVDYGKIEQESDNGSVLATVPLAPYADALPEYGNLGMGWSGDHRSSNDDLNSDADAYRLILSYGKSVSDDLSLGYGVSYHHDKFKTGGMESKMTDGVRQTVGALYKLSDQTNWGSTVFYGFGESEQPSAGLFAPEGNKVKRDLSSWGAETGLSHSYDTGTMVATSFDYTSYDADYDDSSAWGAKLGAEHPVFDWLNVRAGYRYQLNQGFDELDSLNQNAKFSAVSFGAGVPLSEGINLDYGAEYRAVGDGDWSHVLSVGVPFSVCED